MRRQLAPPPARARRAASSDRTREGAAQQVYSPGVHDGARLPLPQLPARHPPAAPAPAPWLWTFHRGLCSARSAPRLVEAHLGESRAPVSASIGHVYPPEPLTSRTRPPPAPLTSRIRPPARLACCSVLPAAGTRALAARRVCRPSPAACSSCGRPRIFTAESRRAALPLSAYTHSSLTVCVVRVVCLDVVF